MRDPPVDVRRGRRTWHAAAWLLLLAAATALPGSVTVAGALPTRTVCTITVNSADEKQAFARHLPAARYRFVELVERHRPDWLASACRAAVACDVLIISGHFDGRSEFFSDQVESNEFLPVAELERASCSESCPRLFSQLKEVYLFGCNTLDPQPLAGASAETVRSLVREGHTLRDAQRQLRELNAEHGQSSQERMRQIFKGVPVIYGFASVAPLGPVAAATLDRYFRAGGASEVGRGRPSGLLLAHFAPQAMSVARGVTELDALTDARGEMCQFADERASDTDRLELIHGLLQKQMAGVRLHLDRIQLQLTALEDPLRRSPAVLQALADIAADSAARSRFLDFARDADLPAVRSQMLDIARDLGWLSAAQRRAELGLMFDALIDRNAVGITEVDLACTLNQAGELDIGANRGTPPRSAADGFARGALRACLGSVEDRARTVQGLFDSDAAQVPIVQTYLRHRPITDAQELHRVATGIARMSPSPAQVRALDLLGRHYLAERETLELLITLYAQTPSGPTQAAVAGLLLRADRRAVAAAPLLRTLREQRRASAQGESMIDALIRHLQTP